MKLLLLLSLVALGCGHDSPTGVVPGPGNSAPQAVTIQFVNQSDTTLYIPSEGGHLAFTEAVRAAAGRAVCAGANDGLPGATARLTIRRSATDTFALVPQFVPADSRGWLVTISATRVVSIVKTDQCAV